MKNICMRLWLITIFHIHTKKLSSPIAWGWEYSYEDPAKIKGFNENKTVVGGFEAIRNCYKNVRKKKLSLRDGECVLVDLRRLLGGSQYPVIWYNYLIATKNNKILTEKLGYPQFFTQLIFEINSPLIKIKTVINNEEGVNLLSTCKKIEKFKKES